MGASRDIIDAARSVMPDAKVVGMERMTGGSSAKVTALALFSPSLGQRRVVFRQHTPDGFKDHGTSVAAKEFGVLRQLHSRGFEVPKPLALHGPAPQDGPWLAMEWVEGTTARADAQVDAAVEAMAHFLSRLHGLADIHVPELTALEDPAQVLDAHLPADRTGGAVAAALRRGIDRRANSSVLLHGDYWPGNVMFDGARLAAVVDWEDAAMGDPLADLACARVEICCAFGLPAAERFTDAYVAHMHSAGNALDLFDLPLWEMYVSATALGSMHLWGLAADDENTRRRHTRSFLERAANEFLACR
ncbi:phosphotransferase [Arthrobacter sp. H35-D1]|uniref:phosphotransferase family protein n=1 Tax=Arthrobacter sp. H35-D1 TaxID=3046202 RepID=UPI0024BB234B|nr:phosphotransferase [Arthrobacter sp. H35-D1]MDJ0314940.1 phosphotransferase [Arthrobacter sp. H35-D1]